MENKKRDDTATLTAQATGYTPHYVRMVINGKRKNDSILTTYNNILTGKQNLVLSAEIEVKSDK